MRGNGDVARGWLAKGESDLTAAELCVEANRALDAACFHSQQAAEKFLKAWLIAHETEFPFVHDLQRLLSLCAGIDPRFASAEAEALLLTPFAVEMRYRANLWPTHAEATAAWAAAKRVRQLVMDRWPTV